MLQVNYIECFDWYTLRVGETLDLTHVTINYIEYFDWYALRVGETLDLTPVTSQLFTMF